MRYSLLLHYPERSVEDLGPEALAEGMRAFQAYAKALDDAGVLASAGCSHSPTRPPPSHWPVVSWSCRTARSPTRRSNSAARSWSMSQTSTPRSNGRVGLHRRRGVMSRIRPTATRYVDGSWQGAQPVK